MMRSKTCEDDPSINIVTRSGVATGEDKVEGKQLDSDSWFRKVNERNVGFDLHREKRDVRGGKKEIYGSRCFYVSEPGADSLTKGET